MICWAKSSAQPTTPAASTGAAGTTYQRYKTRKLAVYEFQGSSKWHNQWCSNLTNSNIKTHRGWDFHLPTQPVCMLLLHLLLQKINCCTTDQASLHRHIWCSEIYWNTEMEGSNKSCEAFDITSRHSQGTPATGEPFLLEKQVDRAGKRRIFHVCSMMLQIMSHNRRHSWQRTELSMLHQWCEPLEIWTGHPDLLYWYSIIIVQ